MPSDPRPKRHRPTRSAAAAGSAPVSSVPPFPSLGAHLASEDVVEVIFGFLDDETLCCATSVSRSFRFSLVPRQRVANLAGFSSFRHFQRFGYRQVEFLSARDSDLVTDDVLRQLAAASNSLPRLSGIDLSGCRNVSSNGVRALVKGLGRRLEVFAQGKSSGNSFHKDVKVTVATIKHVAAAPSLRRIDLILLQKCSGDCLQPLSGHSSLEELTLSFEGGGYNNVATSLPRNLPGLAKLTIQTSSYSFSWCALDDVRYPSVVSVVISDDVGILNYAKRYRVSTLSTAILTRFVSNHPSLELLELENVSQWSELHGEGPGPLSECADQSGVEFRYPAGAFEGTTYQQH